MFNLKFKKENTQKGFTLIEMLVAVAIFSIVVMISLGAILTILDANRKARTLTEVMNNLNFSVEMITRSLKTGVEPDYSATDGGTISVNSIVLDNDSVSESGNFVREKTSYSLKESSGRGYIAVCVKQGGESCSSDDWLPITSDLVDIKQFDIFLVTDSENQDGVIQPRTQIFISGTVQINDKISSDFALQTTVSQRRLNLPGSELD